MSSGMMSALELAQRDGKTVVFRRLPPAWMDILKRGFKADEGPTKEVLLQVTETMRRFETHRKALLKEANMVAPPAP